VTARRPSTRLDFCCYCLLVRNASWFSWLEEGRPAANRRCQSPAECCSCAFGSQGSMGAVRRSGCGPRRRPRPPSSRRGPRTLTVWGWKAKVTTKGSKTRTCWIAPSARATVRASAGSVRKMDSEAARQMTRERKSQVPGAPLRDADPQPLEWYYCTSKTNLRGPAHTITNQY
jgi:hypothetical protein